jgi:hypothetical protein
LHGIPRLIAQVRPDDLKLTVPFDYRLTGGIDGKTRILIGRA